MAPLQRMRWTIRLALSACASAPAFATGCEEYRIEYRTLPAYYWQAAEQEIPGEMRLDDGTIVVQRPATMRRTPSHGGAGEGEDAPPLREVRDDGTVVLRSPDPEHVLHHLFACLQNEEYDLIYEQLLSAPSRSVWEGQGNSFDDFASYFMKNRRELARTLHRLTLGLIHHETHTVSLDHNLVEFSLSPRVAEGLSFRRVRVLIEPDGCRLVTIR